MKEDISGWLVIVGSANKSNPYIPREGLNSLSFPGAPPRNYDRIRFTYLHDNFSEQKSASYTSTQVLGRSEPIRGYLGSSPRTIQLTLEVPIEGDDLPVMSGIPIPHVTSSIKFFTQNDDIPAEQKLQKDLLPNASSIARTTGMDAIFNRKMEVLDFIRSLVYPHYTQETQNMLYPPPRVLVLLGRWFSMLGIVSNWTMTHKGPWAVEGNMSPYFTQVGITVEECDAPYSFRDVYAGVLRPGGVAHAQISGVLNL